MHITGTCDSSISNSFSIIVWIPLCVCWMHWRKWYIHICGEKEHNGTISLHTRETNHAVSFHSCFFTVYNNRFFKLFLQMHSAKLAHLPGFINQYLQITVTCMSYNASCTFHLMIPVRNVSFHYRHSLTYTISGYALPDVTQFEKVKNWNNIFEMCARFFLVELKVEWDEGGGWILLENNTSSRAVMLQLVMFLCVGMWISAGLSCLTYELTVCVLSSDLHPTFWIVTTVFVWKCLWWIIYYK
jgi:hypothetical protein